MNLAEVVECSSPLLPMLLEACCISSGKEPNARADAKTVHRDWGVVIAVLLAKLSFYLVVLPTRYN
jgi:hypothetical protein